MITGLDHDDLPTAITAYREIGFEVDYGGEHVGAATHNALVMLHGAYIELQAATDLERLRTSPHPMAQHVNSWLRGDRQGGWLGYAVRTDDVAGTHDLLEVAGLAPATLEATRQAPDGSELRWQLLLPHGMPWGSPWPLVVAADSDAARRLAQSGPGAHRNKAERVQLVRIAAANREKALECHTVLGLTDLPIELVDEPTSQHGITEVWFSSSSPDMPTDAIDVHGARVRFVGACSQPDR